MKTNPAKLKEEMQVEIEDADVQVAIQPDEDYSEARARIDQIKQ